MKKIDYSKEGGKRKHKKAEEKEENKHTERRKKG